MEAWLDSRRNISCSQAFAASGISSFSPGRLSTLIVGAGYVTLGAKNLGVVRYLMAGAAIFLIWFGQPADPVRNGLPFTFAWTPPGLEKVPNSKSILIEIMISASNSEHHLTRDEWPQPKIGDWEITRLDKARTIDRQFSSDKVGFERLKDEKVMWHVTLDWSGLVNQTLSNCNRFWASNWILFPSLDGCRK